MLPCLKPQKFYDLVIEVVIIRPGPIQGDMVHLYLKRRNGEEPVEFPSEELRDILGRTLGVPLFQEQAMEIAIVAAGFTPAEVDGLRRSMATFKSKGKVSCYREKLVGGMVKEVIPKSLLRGYLNKLKDLAAWLSGKPCCQLCVAVYNSSWMKYHYPDILAAALLTASQWAFTVRRKLLLMPAGMVRK
jgi:error-prone DNA polymerase